MTAQTSLDEYNGWTNRETWACHLWITNDQNTDRQARETCLQAVQDCAEWWAEHPELGPTPDDGPAFRAGEALAEWYAELTDLDRLARQYEYPCYPGDRDAVRPIRSMALDVGSAWRINWTEIAQALLTD